MGYSVSQSLISGQPPLLVFTICLTAFGLSMVILAYVVGEQDVPNPDVQMDWNKFFKKISYLKLCTLQNDTRSTNDGGMQKKGSFKSSIDSALNSSNSHIVDKSISAVLSDVVDGATDDDLNKFALVNIAVKVQFGLRGKLPSDSMYMKGTVNGKLLGFSGKYSSLLFNISLSFRPLHNSSCDGAKCHSLYEACLLMSLPADLLPETKSPERCKAGDYIEQEAQPIYFSESQILSQKDASALCIELDYTPDAKLTEMLSLQDRSIVNLHLMHTSYFMFVMVMTLVCYSLIKGRYRHPKNSLSLEKIPLDA